jgi:hypothetical protein
MAEWRNGSLHPRPARYSRPVQALGDLGGHLGSRDVDVDLFVSHQVPHDLDEYFRHRLELPGP